ncbi:GntR family transcriptional regulator [Ottowia thiooxydans]|uniref:GntR family transcriptional regulator n=1 Tax=Ottowia thiooxydans TaxID=219182 RepID=UPI00041FC69F|nr:GntR family transcriptional regulator [Ottowia thiooxydans]
MQPRAPVEPTDSAEARPNTHDGVYQSIRERILSMVNTIEEPVHLREEDVAQELSVSRTPVREALKRLGQEGLLSLQPRRGAVLMPVTHKEYTDWLKLRAELESFTASEAALNASKRDVDHLRSIFAPFNESNLSERADEYAAANVAFHADLMRLANNVVLEKIWKSFGHGQMLRFKTIQRLNRAHDSLREHLDIIDAINARDAELASQLAKSHVLGLLGQVNKSR